MFLRAGRKASLCGMLELPSSPPNSGKREARLILRLTLASVSDFVQRINSRAVASRYRDYAVPCGSCLALEVLYQ